MPADFIGFSSRVFENTRWEKNYPDDFVIINDLLYRYKGNEKIINIPDCVKIIGQYALAFSDIESVTVSDCVDEIRDSAFCGCKKLVSVTLPDSIKKINMCTFYNCESLEKINLPDSIEEIGFEAFNGCRKLSDIKLPKNLKVIDTRAFKDIERQDLNFDVYEEDKKIIHVEYHKEKDEAVVNLSSKYDSFNFSYEGENSWEDIEYFLLRRIVNCNPEDPIEYLKETKGKLWHDPISIKFNL